MEASRCDRFHRQRYPDAREFPAVPTVTDAAARAEQNLEYSTVTREFDTQSHDAGAHVE
jgi:hypothetical protein